MAEITLSEYVGFIFSEVVRARAIADLESRKVALTYAQDGVLQYFSVPRFKIPEMELTIPVLISGARYSTALLFMMKREDFLAFIESKLIHVVRSVLIRRKQIDIIVTKPFFPKVPGLARASKEIQKAATSQEGANEFYEQLTKNDGNSPDNIIQDKWYDIFWKRIQEANLIEDYNKFFPNNDLFKQSLTEVTEKIKQNTAVSNVRIENLLVNPETNMVKNGSDPTSVFVMKAKIMEEGIFIKTIRDGTTGEEKQVVEFE